MTSSLRLTGLAAACFLCFAAPMQAHAFDGCTVMSASPLVVNVKDRGAKGDGKSNDTPAIQKAIDEVAVTGGTVYVPKGTYMVRGTGKNRLHLPSKVTLKLADGAILKVIPNGAKSYSVLKIADATDVTVIGGTLLGDRSEHMGGAGEWGMGIFIGPNAARVSVIGVTAKEMWGDGFYVGDATDVAFCSVAAIHNRRQGLSIIEGSRLLVTNSVFKDTRGTRPSAGIDLEPDRPDQKVTNVLIERSKFIDNAGSGVAIAGKKGDVTNVQISHNVFEGGQPIKIENAPRVHSTQICKNRYIAKEIPASEGFNSFAEPVDIVALQSDCNAGRDMRFEINRTNKRKKKPPQN
jgi:polygalacturonase